MQRVRITDPYSDPRAVQRQILNSEANDKKKERIRGVRFLVKANMCHAPLARVLSCQNCENTG